MKRKFLAACLLCSVLLTISCSKDDENPDDSKVNHVGEKWNITSVQFDIIEQKFSPPSQSFDNGTETDAGAFYFDGAKGSFDIQLEGYHKEDYFSFTEDANGVSIVSVSQNVGGSKVSQFTISLSGEKTSATTMTLEGSITKQTQSEQFMMDATFELTKN